MLSGFLLTSLTAIVAAGPPPGDAGGAAEREVVAELAGEPIHLDEVEPRAAVEVYRLRADLHRLLADATRELAERRVLERAADERGTTVEELLAAEVDARVDEPSAEEVAAYLAERPEVDAADERIRERAELYLHETERIRRRNELVDELLAAAGYHFLRSPPEPIRARIDLAGAPARGPADAPLTVVHFAHFACRRCVESAQKVDRLEGELGERVRRVHRFAIERPTDPAVGAAGLALVAAEQGRFWEVHDRLFALGGRPSPDDLAALAGELGIEWSGPASLPGPIVSALGEELAAARRLGVDQPPMIFVNGRFFHPTYPYRDLRELVDRELAAAEAVAPTPPAAAAPSPTESNDRSPLR